MKTLIEQQRKYYQQGTTKSYEFRKEQLIKLKESIKKHEQEIKDALYVDLHKSSFEAYTTEIGFLLHSIDLAVKNLKKWMKPRKVKTPIYMIGSSSYIMPEPLGVVLIIGPYNYPFQLVMEPLVGAIAAGNTAILKPSEFTPATEKVIEKVISSTFGPEYIKVITGDYKVTQELLENRFDYIFFTGSTRVGQIVYEKASKHLTPVTLELGGKSPTIIDETANLKLAARRIAFGKFINAGQTCIAPDYIYVHESVHEAFLNELKTVLNSDYKDEKTFGRIVNERHFKRLNGLISDSKMVYGHKIDEDEKLISPIILDQVSWNDEVMKEEIFGPILPILTYKNIDELITFIQSLDKPLALYLFTNQKETMDKVFNQISFGGGAINHTLMHVSNPHLPFGGVGHSGIGKYHGSTSFDIFTHYKGYIKTTNKFDLKMAYPPYTDKKEKLVKKILK